MAGDPNAFAEGHGGAGAAPAPSNRIERAEDNSGQGWVQPEEFKNREIVKPSKVKTPTNRTPGVNVPRGPLGSRAFGKAVKEVHTLLTGRANELNAKAGVSQRRAEPNRPLSGEVEQRINNTTGVTNSGGTRTSWPSPIAGDDRTGVVAEHHVEQANVFLGKALESHTHGDDARRGTNNGGRNPAGKISEAEANGHYLTALGHLDTAHGYLHSDEVKDAVGRSKVDLSSESVSKEHIKGLKALGKGLRVIKQKPYKEVYAGKGTRLKVGSKEFKETEEQAKKTLEKNPGKFTGELLEKMGRAKRGDGKKGAVAKGRAKVQKETGFMATQQDNETTPANRPTPSTRKKGTGVMAQGKIGVIANVPKGGKK